MTNKFMSISSRNAPRPTDDCFSDSVYSFLKCICYCLHLGFTYCSTVVLPSLQHVVSLCVGKLDRLMFSTCQPGLINNIKLTNILYHMISFFNGVGTVVTVFLVHTIWFVLYVVKYINEIGCRMTEMLLYPVKRFHSDNCKGFPCHYSYMYSTV